MLKTVGIRLCKNDYKEKLPPRVKTKVQIIVKVVFTIELENFVGKFPERQLKS